MKFVVIAKTQQVAQQALLLDGCACVADLHAAPIGLASHRAIAFEQIAEQHFADRAFLVVGAQQVRRGCELCALQVQAVQAQALQLLHALALKVRRRDQTYADGCAGLCAAPGGFAQVLAQALTQGIGVGKARAGKAVQVELERFALDDVQAFAGHSELRQRNLRFAARIEPAQFVSGPQVGAKKRRRAGQADLGATWRARDGKEQACVVLVRIHRGLAQGRITSVRHAAAR